MAGCVYRINFQEDIVTFSSTSSHRKSRHGTTNNKDLQWIRRANGRILRKLSLLGTWRYLAVPSTPQQTQMVLTEVPRRLAPETLSNHLQKRANTITTASKWLHSPQHQVSYQCINLQRHTLVLDVLDLNTVFVKKMFIRYRYLSRWVIKKK